MPRHCAALQVGGSGYRCHLQVLAQLHRDHVLFQSFAEPDSGVEASLDNIGHHVIDDDGQVDIGIGTLEIAQYGRNEPHRGHARHIDAHRTSRLVARCINIRNGTLQLPERNAEPGK